MIKAILVFTACLIMAAVAGAFLLLFTKRNE